MCSFLSTFIFVFFSMTLLALYIITGSVHEAKPSHPVVKSNIITSSVLEFIRADIDGL